MEKTKITYMGQELDKSDGSTPLEGRQETFCSLIVPGTMTPTEAYRQAGFSRKNAKNNSSRLSAKEGIKARIAYIRAERACEAGITREGQTLKLAIIQERCLAAGEHSTYVRAVEATNRMYGLDKQVIETHSDVPMTKSEQEQADVWAEFRLWEASRGGPRLVDIREGA